MIKEAKRKAVESLIKDDDPHTRRLLIDELSATYTENKSLLSELVRSKCPDAQRFAQEVLNKCGKADQQKVLPESRDAESDDVLRPRGWEHLESFSWWLARQNDPSFDCTSGVKQLDEWAEMVDDVSPGCSCAEDRIKRLRKVLSQDLGLRGDFVDYYSADNSYLNRVIERKKGIPLSLTLIYIFVGRRVGWKVRGLNMPGHYLACVDNIVFDPFFNAKILSCSELKERYFLPECEFRDLEPYHAEPAETAHRVLANLYNSYMRAGDCDRLMQIADYLQSLSENS
ncbi:MAG: transglutaminase-like domain-containing protein [Verrucomicrobiota bacterium]